MGGLLPFLLNILFLKYFSFLLLKNLVFVVAQGVIGAATKILATEVTQCYATLCISIFSQGIGTERGHVFLFIEVGFLTGEEILNYPCFLGLRLNIWLGLLRAFYITRLAWLTYSL